MKTDWLGEMVGPARMIAAVARMGNGTVGAPFSKVLHQASLIFVLIGTAAIFSSRPALADSIDFAVDAVVVGGAAIGIVISPTDAALIKPLARCVAAGKPVVDCIKETVIQQLPKESQGLVRCVAGGKNVEQCAKEVAIQQLPPQSQELAKCIAGGSDVVECGKKFATTEAEKAAFGAVNKLKADAKDKFAEVAGPLQNIIAVADGIAREDWEKVITSGGKAVAVYVINTTISSLLTPATAYISGPIIDTIVANRIDLVADLIKALKSGDVPLIAQIVTEAYLTLSAEIPCALLPEGAVKEAICGTLGKIIGAVGKAAGNITGFVVDTIGGILNDIGITDLFDGIFSGIGDFLGLGDDKADDCGSPEEFFAKNFTICYNRASYLKSTDPAGYARFEDDLFHSCHVHFFRCFKFDTVESICNPLRQMFGKQAQTLNQALNISAGALAKSRRPYLEANRSRVCSPYYYQGEVDNFVNSCENSLKDRFPTVGDALSPSCKPDPKRCEGMFACSTPTAQQAACRQAADGEIKRISSDVCLGAGTCFPVDTPPPEDVIK